MPQPETSAAVARIISNFAKQYPALEADSFPATAISNGLKKHQITLPGDDTIEKRTLERELNGLAARIQFLEARALSGTSSLPITPNEPLASAFAPDASTSPRASLSGQRNRSASWVNTIFSKNDGDLNARTLTTEQFALLRDHVNEQARLIENQRETIEQLDRRITIHESTADHLKQGESVGQLKREIEKNTQINATYQKVLREIGTIITAVANGDLSKKVLIHATEKDPEIAKFKHTINKMVDQLQEFASQVTQLAREVGTEGRLGGQAKVPGVAGIWADLTANGKLK